MTTPFPIRYFNDKSKMVGGVSKGLPSFNETQKLTEKNTKKQHGGVSKRLPSSDPFQKLINKNTRK